MMRTLTANERLMSNHDNPIFPVLGRIPSGVFILTASDGEGQETGMLASWVQQAAFEPQQVTVAVNGSRYVNQWLKDGVYIGLNLIGESGGKLLGHFGKGFEPDADAFDGLDTETVSGVRVLNDAIGYLIGKVVSRMITGDHVVYLIELTDAATSENFDDEKPMVHIRKSGGHY